MSAFSGIVILVLIALTGLYVAAEFAAVSVRRSRIRQLAEEGDRTARNLLPTLEDPRLLDRYIAASQVGITIASLVLGAYGQSSLSEALSPVLEGLGGMQAPLARSTSAVIVLAALTILTMVMGELVPKSLALQYPTQVARATLLPMRWSERALSWFIVVLNGSAWAVLRLLRVEPAGHRHLHSPEEIQFLIAESREGGHLRPDEQRRLNYALGLTQREARELMVPRTQVVALEVATDLGSAVEKAAATPYTRLPVYRSSLDEIVGLVHVKDMTFAQLGGDAGISLAAMVRPIAVVHEQFSADRVLSVMRRERGMMAVVVDDFGGTAGIITAEDILTELLGEAADQLVFGSASPTPLPDGRVRLPGDLPVRDSGRWVGVSWEGEAATVGGLIVEHLGRFPESGEVLEIDGVPVEIELVEGRVVRSVIVGPVGGTGKDTTRRRGRGTGRQQGETRP